MAVQPEPPDEDLVRLAYDVRRLVQGGKYAKMQALVDEEAKRRGLSGWELAHQLADVGIERGIAHAPELVPAEDLE